MNSLTFRLLQVYQQVVDSGSITAASVTLSLSQPTVSLQLKKLASLFDMVLLEQHHGRLQMTDAGKAVYRCAQEVLSSQARLDSHMRALQGMEVGSLKIAVVTTAKYVVPTLLGQFCREHPGIDITLKVGNRAQIIERVKGNQDDIYIFSQPPKDLAISAKAFMLNKLCVIAPPGFDGPDNCSLGALSSYKFLLREEGSGTRKMIDDYCEKHDIVFKKVMVIESNEAIRLSVATGLGLAIVSEQTLQHMRSDDVKILNVSDFPLRSAWQIVTLDGRPESLAASAFSKFLLAHGDVDKQH
ncbi:LysR family transcriptional regulator [Alteromonas oceanisediminis]|uniref:LysR family transcriptional regulator n=1 Tax=Alteromonas oceanisediminis TaxID=2836180 RepID=UPI001BDA28AF|nr:LysR family transcriptional regulator [Alteromonas oceanisediminis]MBT0586012.1 LysR family transcriptional regulator [Alteromonas oceanisediminis]